MMSLSILANDRGGFGLFRGDEQVGWVEGRAVALFGFETAEVAQRAARAAFDSLRGWLARQRRTHLVPGPTQTLRPRQSGSQVKLMLGSAAIGRIIAPNDAGLGRSDYGFELLLPPGLGPVDGISAAKIIEAALRRRAAVQQLAPVALVA